MVFQKFLGSGQIYGKYDERFIVRFRNLAWKPHISGGAYLYGHIFQWLL